MKQEEYALAAVIVVVIVFAAYFFFQGEQEKTFQRLLDAECRALEAGNVKQLLAHTTLTEGSAAYEEKLAEKEELLATVDVVACQQDIVSLDAGEDRVITQVDLSMTLAAQGEQHTTNNRKSTTFVATPGGWKIEPHEGF